MKKTHWYGFYCDEWIYGDEHTADQSQITCRRCRSRLADDVGATDQTPDDIQRENARTLLGDNTK